MPGSHHERADKKSVDTNAKPCPARPARLDGVVADLRRLHVAGVGQLRVISRAALAVPCALERKTQARH